MDHCNRNHHSTSLQNKIEYKKAYSVIKSTQSFNNFTPVLQSQRDYQSFDLSSYLMSNTFFLNTILNNNFVFKYLLIRSVEFYNKSRYNITLSTMKPILQTINTFYFNSRFDLIHKSNLIPTPSFNYLIQRRLLKCFALRKFLSPTGA